MDIAMDTLHQPLLVGNKQLSPAIKTALFASKARATQRVSEREEEESIRRDDATGKRTMSRTASGELYDIGLD